MTTSWAVLKLVILIHDITDLLVATIERWAKYFHFWLINYMMWLLRGRNQTGLEKYEQDIATSACTA